MPPLIPLSIYYLQAREPNQHGQITQMLHQKGQAFKLFTEPEPLLQSLYEVDNAIIFSMGFPAKFDVSAFKPSVSAFNIHFGPLPDFRGPSPVFWQLKNGAAMLGMTIHYLDQGWDTGAVVWEKWIPRQDFFNFKTVHQIFSAQSLEGILYIYNQLCASKQLPVIPHQRPNQYHKKPQAADVIINFSSMDANTVYQLIQACNPWNKGAICHFRQQQLNILHAFPALAPLPNKPLGDFYLHGGALWVNCAANTALTIQSVQWQESFWHAAHLVQAGVFG